MKDKPKKSLRERKYYCPNCKKKRHLVNNLFCESCGQEIQKKRCKGEKKK